MRSGPRHQGSLKASWHLQSEVADIHQLVQVEGFVLSWVDTSAGGRARPGGFSSLWHDTALEEAAEPGSGLTADLE